jgi:3-hydroxyacyl-CoA dehydrogenase / enoyl-CoA hydratase / 3-hydroxybutyryl-CoA epimerase
MSGSYQHWRIERDADEIAWLIFDRAGRSANTFSVEVLEELSRTLDELEATPPRALIIRSGKESGFIAGADIEEFTKIDSVAGARKMVQAGWDAFDKLAAVPFPSVALIRGFCLGGGLELALACRYRVVVDEASTKLGLPEVMLGIVPGWGAMLRLPQRIGAPAALDMLLSGRNVDARRAKKLGLADECVPLRIMMNTAKMLALSPPRERWPGFWLSLTNDGPFRPFVASSARKSVAKRARPDQYPAPYAILDIWQNFGGNALLVPDDSPSSLASIFRGETARNLIRIFFLQERLKNIGKDVDFAPRHVHVIGAGVMGGDIAAWCAMRGLTATLQDQSAERLAPAIKRAGELFARRLKDPARIRDASDRLIPDVAGDGAANADVVIEAIFENLEAKRALFAGLEKKMKPGAIMATNTSSLKLEDIAANLVNPSRLIGLHFFNPVPQMPLVEIVGAANTDKEAVRRGAAFVRGIDKLPLPVKSSPGFLVNRVLGPYMNAAIRLLDERVEDAETIDAAAVRFGMPMGPIELADTVGLDICLAAGKALAGDAEPPKNLMKLIDAGHLGKKTGRGFYVWRDGKAQKGSAGKVTEALIERLIAPYLKEAQACLREGIAGDEDLTDAGLIFGTGFAPFRGGPLNFLKTHPLRS